jgi:hypothetical protein
MPILKSEDFSNARASFFVRLSIKFGVSTEKKQRHLGKSNPLRFSQPLSCAGRGLY